MLINLNYADPMKLPKKSIKTYFLLIEKMLFIVLLVFFTMMYFSEKKISGKQILISKIDRLIVSLKKENQIKKAIEKENEIYKLAKEIDYKKGLAASRVALVRKMFNQHKYDLTLKLIDKSLKESPEIDDPFYTVRLLVMRSNCYSALGLYQESRAVLNQAKTLALTLPSNKDHHYALSMIFRQQAVDSHSADSAIFYFKSSYNHFKKTIPDSSYSLTCIDLLTQIGHLYSNKQQYDSARKYLSNIYLIRETDKQKDVMLRLQSYAHIAELHLINNEYRKAITDHQNILRISDSLNLSYYKKGAYLRLSQIYGALSDKKMENYYLKVYSKISDSLRSTEKVNIRDPLEKIITEKENYTDKSKALYTLIPIILVCIAGFGLIRFYKQKKRDALAHKNMAQTHAQPKSMSSGSLEGSKSDEALKHIIELARQNDATLYAQFKAFDPDFTPNLLSIAPDLLASELEMCMYFRLNFGTKEIVNYTDFSVRAVQAKKQRIRKKLKISSSENLNTWLINL